MKLAVAIVNDDDAGVIIDSLREEGFAVTKLSSTGGFLRLGNTTLISGVDDDKVKQLVAIIEREGRSRTQVAPATPSFFEALQAPVEVTVGGTTIFVLDVDQFIKV